MASSTDWNANLYDDTAHFVTEYGKNLVELLKPQPGERILDIGCGTGHLTKQIKDMGCDIVGLDASANMIETAKAAYPDVEFIHADASDFSFDEPFDAIFSNAALHWVLKADEAVACMSKALKPSGRFVIEMGGKGNIQTMIWGLFEALKQFDCDDPSHAWFFPSIVEYTSKMERNGIEATTAWLFDRPTKLDGDEGIRNWFKVFGEAIHADVSDECFDEAVIAAEEIMRPTLYRDGVWYADYRRLRIIGRKLS